MKVEDGEERVTGIGTKQVQTLITSMKCSKKSRENVVDDLLAIQAAARKWYPNVQVVHKKDLYFPGVEPQEPFSFTPEQMRAILEYFKDRRPWNLFFTLLPLSGFRAGETLGLRVTDLDFQRNLIHVRQAAWHGKIQTVKTKASRKPSP